MPDQRVEIVLRTLAAPLESFGGLPLMAVFERPKTIVARSDPRTGAVLDWNPTFAGVNTHLGVAVEVYWPYLANQKGSVEDLMGSVGGSIFRQRWFLDTEDLDIRLEPWHQEVNE